MEDVYHNGYIRFNIDERYNAYFDADKHYRVELQIQKYSSTSATTTDGAPFNITLSIRNNVDNDDVFNDYAEYLVKDCYKFKFKIVNVWAWTCATEPCEPTAADKITTAGGFSALPGSINITYGIEVERYIEFDETEVAPVIVAYDNTPTSDHYKHITISNYYLDGAYAYDIEWTYVNSYGEDGSTLVLADIPYYFRNNSSRIRVYEEQSIELPAIFDKGYVIARVRGIGKEEVGGNLVDLVGRWSLYDHYDEMSFYPYDMSGVSTSYYVQVDPSATLKVHENDKNWMMQTSYAEEGKMKNVITYYDGTFRGRQVVTQNPYITDKEILISETFYDHVGRPAAQSLPVPHHNSGTTTVVKEMKYYTDFNQVDLGVAGLDKFGLKYFERSEEDACEPHVLPFDNSTGSAAYYSDNNLNQNANNAFIPDAFGYAYTLTEFTNDNSGRVRRQTGVGPDHILGSGHETKNYYGMPEQEELDRVFGNNAGNANHYQKNLVVDPNGQVSVSYLDMKGNVIATALAGTSPTNLVPLKSETTGTGDFLYETMSDPITVNALGAGSEEYPFGANNLYDPDLQSLSVNKNFLVTADNTDYEFFYEVKDIDYIDACMDDLCFDCVFDLHISLLDNCGEELLNAGAGITIQVGDMPVAEGSINSTSCATSYEDWTETLSLDIGSYQLVKTLTLNQDAVNVYAELYMDHLLADTEDPCLIPYSEFEAAVAAELNIAEICGDFSCEACNTIQTIEDFNTAFPQFETDYGYSEEVISELFEQYRSNCEIYCEGIGVDWCTTGYNMMLTDMRPGGQYAKYTDPETGLIDPAALPMSILNETGVMQHRFVTGSDEAPDWKNPLIYLDVDPDGAGGPLTDEWNHAYLNEDNTLAYVIPLYGVASDPVLVDDEDYIIVDGYKFTRPENLVNVEDFITYYLLHPEWARSLVVYHPEYFYYEYCKGISTVEENVTTAAGSEPMNTYQFDAFLLSLAGSTDFTSITSLGLINFAVTPETQLDNILAMDPLFDGGTACPDPNPAGTDYDLLKSAFKTALNNQTCYGSGAAADVHFTIWQAVYLMHDYIDLTPGVTTDCPDPGDLDGDDLSDLFVDGAGNALDRWRTFANIYLSTKQQFIWDNMNDYAQAFYFIPDDGGYRYDNYCIGSDDYVIDGIISVDEFYFLMGENNSCSATRAPQLGQLTARFPSISNALDLEADFTDDPAAAMTEITAEGAYAYWYETGNGAISLDLLNFLNGMLFNGEFYETNYNLTGGFSPGTPISAALYNALHPTCDNIIGEVDPLNAYRLVFHESGTGYLSPDANIVLSIENETGYLYDNWSDLDNPANYQYQNFNGLDVTGDYAFILYLDVIDLTDDQTKTIKLSGTTTVNITDVYAFMTDAIDCNNTPGAATLELLFQDLLLNNNFFSTSFEVGNDDLIALMESTLSSYIGHAPYVWENLTTPTRTYKLSGSSSYFYITFYAQDPYGFDLEDDNYYEGIRTTSTFLDNLEALYTGTTWNVGKINDFKAKFYVGATEYTTYGEVVWDNQFSDRLEGFAIADCDYPIDVPCIDQENFNLVKLEYFLQELVEATNFTVDETVISGTDYFTPRLEQLFGEETGEEEVKWDITTIGEHHMEVSIKTDAVQTCTFEFDLSAPEGVELTDITSLGDLEADLTYAIGEITYAFTIPAYVGATAYVLFGTSTCVPIKNCECGDVPTDNDIEDEMLLLEVKMITDATGTDYDDPVFFITDGLGITKTWLCNYKQSGWDGISLKHNGMGAGINYYSWYDYYFTPDLIDTLNYPLWVNKTFPGSPTGYNILDPFAVCDERFSGGVWERDPNYIGRSVLAYVNDRNASDPAPCKPDPIVFGDPGDPYLCADLIADMIDLQAEINYNEYLQEVEDEFKANFTAHCINSLEAADNNENLTYSYESAEYHYTLYYYDLGGNLAMTVPPKGVDFLTDTEVGDVANARTTTTPTDDVFPQHTLKSHYHYNSLNQLTDQETPDAGTSNFWYDHLGRLVLSQNAEQNQPIGTDQEKYSYTVFDELGRIIQVGELTCPQNIELSGTFNDDINDDAFPGNIDDDRNSVTQTYYNEGFTFASSPFGTDGQQNLRNRIAYSTIEEDYDASDATFDFATHYSYDIHGNVTTLVQDNPALDDLGNQYKVVDYIFDLISGKVNQVDYQKGKPDRYSQRYSYDAVNRLIEVESSVDARTWETEAAYFYYRHGPLMRQEIGDMMVQGVDYAYTIQGWLKGVNAGALNTNKDMGNDAKPRTAALNTHQRVASDAYGFILDYFNGDYTQISTSTTSFIPEQGAIVGASFDYYDYYDNTNSPELYNGNIRGMSTALMKTDRTKMDVLGKNYQYDQLNRLVASYSFIKSGMHVNNTSFSWSGVAVDNLNRWGTSYVYDGMGNILSMERSGNTGTSPVGGVRQFDMDKFTYNYYANSGSSMEGSNQLEYVDDPVSNTAYDVDLDDEAAGNYEYDKIGNLTKDVKEGINDITWTIYGKIATIDKTSGPDLAFAYDAIGNRIMKKVTPTTGPTVYTYYTRDAKGNVLSVYTRTEEGATNTIHLSEQHLYGSSRLGMISVDINVDATVDDPDPNAIYFYRYLGNKRYELVNHLGNVLSVITDRRFQIRETATGYTHTVKYYEPDVVQYSDYDPFGMLLVGRVNDNMYRFGFNGKEGTFEIYSDNSAIDFGARILDSKIGRWMNLDPLTNKYPNVSPFVFCINNPLAYIDPNGEKIELSFEDESTKEAYTCVMNQALEGQFEVKLTQTGGGTYMLEIVPTAGGGSQDQMTSGAVEFYTLVNFIAQDPFTTVEHDIVSDEANTTAGSYQLNTLDIVDVMQYPEQTEKNYGYERTQSSVIAHEIAEQYEKAKKGIPKGDLGKVDGFLYEKEGKYYYTTQPTDFIEDHSVAVDAEQRVGGYEVVFDLDSGPKDVNYDGVDDYSGGFDTIIRTKDKGMKIVKQQTKNDKNNTYEVSQ